MIYSYYTEIDCTDLNNIQSVHPSLTQGWELSNGKLNYTITYTDGTENDGKRMLTRSS